MRIFFQRASLLLIFILGLYSHVQSKPNSNINIIVQQTFRILHNLDFQHINKIKNQPPQIHSKIGSTLQTGISGTLYGLDDEAIFSAFVEIFSADSIDVLLSGVDLFSRCSLIEDRLIPKWIQENIKDIDQKDEGTCSRPD